MSPRSPIFTKAEADKHGLVSGLHFTFLVRRHLLLIKHGYCGKCCLVKPLEEFIRGKHRECRRCNAATVTAWRKTPAGQTKDRAWRASNQDKCRKYWRDYARRKKEKQS